MKYIECFSISKEKIKEVEYQCKMGTSEKDIKAYARQKQLRGQIDGYRIENNNIIIFESYGARLCQ